LLEYNYESLRGETWWLKRYRCKKRGKEAAEKIYREEKERCKKTLSSPLHISLDYSGSYSNKDMDHLKLD
jgi:hypothetical protein